MNLFYQVQSLWFFLLYYLTLYSYVAIIIDANTFPKILTKKNQPKTYSWPTSNFFNCYCSCWESSKQKWEYVINTVLSDVSVCSTIKSIVQSLTLISILFFQGSSENVDTKKLSLKVVPYLNGSWIGKSVQSYLSLFMWIQTASILNE